MELREMDCDGKYISLKYRGVIFKLVLLTGLCFKAFTVVWLNSAKKGFALPVSHFD